MTSHSRSSLVRGAAVSALIVFAGYGTAANAAGPSPGNIGSGTSLSDSRIARDAELKASDFPRGWFSFPGPTSLGHSPCAGINGAQAAVSGASISPQFTSKSASTADSTTYVYSDASEATHWFGQLTSRDTRECVARKVHQSAVESAQGVKNVTIGPVREHGLSTPRVGNQAAGTRLSLRVSSGGIGLTADADLMFVRVGRSIVVFDFSNVGSPFDRGFEAKLMHAVAGRLARDLAGGS